MLHEVKDKIQREAQELWEKNNYKGLIALCTGAGKSKIAVNIVSDPKYSGKWLLVVPTEKLRDTNWKEEFKKWKQLKDYNRLDRTCYASLKNINLLDYEGVVLDESHNVTSANTEVFMNLSKEQLNNLKILCLTATPPNDDEKKDILYNKLGCKVILKISLDEGVKLGIVSPYRITVVEGYLDDTKKTIETGGGGKKWLSTEFAIYQYKSRNITKMRFSGKPVPKFMYLDRMRFIYNLPSKTENAKKILSKIDKNERTILFCGSIEQAEKLCENTWHSKSKIDTLSLFKKKKINQLATVKIINEGENIPDVDNILIVQLDSNALNLIQRIGRAVRLREGHVANIFILTTMQTQDESWVEKALENFDRNNINYVSIKNYD